VNHIYLHGFDSDNFMCHIVTGYRTRGVGRRCVTKAVVYSSQNGKEDR
jgi:hypothetical protein